MHRLTGSDQEAFDRIVDCTRGTSGIAINVLMRVSVLLRQWKQDIGRAETPDSPGPVHKISIDDTESNADRAHPLR